MMRNPLFFRAFNNSSKASKRILVISLLALAQVIVTLVLTFTLPGSSLINSVSTQWLIDFLYWLGLFWMLTFYTIFISASSYQILFTDTVENKLVFYLSALVCVHGIIVSMGQLWWFCFGFILWPDNGNDFKKYRAVAVIVGIVVGLCGISALVHGWLMVLYAWKDVRYAYRGVPLDEARNVRLERLERIIRRSERV
jgi:hypothetical protein